MKLYEVGYSEILSGNPRDLQVSINYLYFYIGHTIYAASLSTMEVIATWSSDYLRAFYVHSDSRMVVATSTLNWSSDWGRLKCYVLSFDGTSFSVIANSPNTSAYDIVYRSDNYCWCNNDYAYIKHDCTVKCIRISSNTDFNAWNPGFPEQTCCVSGNNNYLFVMTRRLYTTGLAKSYAFSIGSGGTLSILDTSVGEENDVYYNGVYTDSNNTTYTQTRCYGYSGSGIVVYGFSNIYDPNTPVYVGLVGTGDLFVFTSYSPAVGIYVNSIVNGVFIYKAYLSVDYHALDKIVSRDLKWLYVSDATNKKIYKYGFIDTKDLLTVDITHT